MLMPSLMSYSGLGGLCRGVGDRTCPPPARGLYRGEGGGGGAGGNAAWLKNFKKFYFFRVGFRIFYIAPKIYFLAVPIESYIIEP